MTGATCRSPRRASGFSLVELAVVLAIIGLALGGALLTLSAQQDARRFAEAQAQLEYARELLLAFAIANRRLPCPATAAAGTGDEAPSGGGTCTNFYGGFLPGRAIGYQPLDPAGYALDAWGNRLRYAVSKQQFGPTMLGRFTIAHTPTNAELKWSLAFTPGDLYVCSASPAVVTNTLCDAGTALTNPGVVVAIVFSTGKNGATGGTGTNEARNLDGNELFVSRTPDPVSAVGGEFDDLLVWIPTSTLYGRMIAAGILP